jgi:hypothetical protein
MSIFASKNTKDIPIPGMNGHTATIRKLKGKEFDESQSAHLASMVAGRSARGWSQAFARVLTNGSEKDAQQVLRDPLKGHDRFVIVKAGLVKWTLAEELKPETLDDLDDESVEHFAVEIMRLTKPELFQTVEEMEDAAKKG